MRFSPRAGSHALCRVRVKSMLTLPTKGGDALFVQRCRGRGTPSEGRAVRERLSARRSTTSMHCHRSLTAVAIGLCASTAVDAQPLAGRTAALRSDVRLHDQPASRRPTVALWTSVAPVGHDSTDRWFARDKARHFGASAAIQLMGYGLLHIAGMSRSQSMLGATLVTASAGIGKELWDRGGRGTPSGRDLVWDAVGLLTGSGLVRIGDPP